MIKVKVSIKGAPRKINISQYSGNNTNSVGNCFFFINDSNCTVADFWFVIDDLDEFDSRCRVPLENIYYFTGEHSYPVNYFSSVKAENFLQQFNKIFSSQAIYLKNVKSELPFLPWMINSNHGNKILTPHFRDLTFLSTNNEVNKSKLLSVICSTKTYTPDHKMRLRFVKYLKAYFKENLDWFGNGVHPLPEKWPGIYPYKYHLVLENQSSINIISEKLYDSFLGMAHPFYWGAPNVHEYFPIKSLTPINILDINGSISKIMEVIDNNTYEKNNNERLLAKNKVLFEYNIFMRLSQVASNNYVENNNAKNFIKLFSFNSRVFDRIKNLFT